MLAVLMHCLRTQQIYLTTALVSAYRWLAPGKAPDQMDNNGPTTLVPTLCPHGDFNTPSHVPIMTF